MSAEHSVVCQKWEESESGWGVRPDGYSLHLNEADRKAFVTVYWERMPDVPPNEYSRPSGTPYACEVDAVTYREVQEARNVHGIRFYDNRYPGNGGTDGWTRM